MKKILLFILLFFPFYSVYSQVAYNDAVELKVLFGKPITQISYEKIGKILAKYLPAKSTDSTYDLVRLEFSDNPFFAATTLPIATTYFGYQSQNASAKIGGIFSAMGQLDVTAFADGLAKFLVKRTKEELYVTFFSKLQDTTVYPEFKYLFPHTKLLVDNFKNWEYANVMNTLREAFDKDFKTLLENLPKIGEIDASKDIYSDAVKRRVAAVKTFFASDNGLLFLAASGIANGFITEQKIPDIYHNISNSYLIKTQVVQGDSSLMNAIKLFDILSYSLKSSIAGESYIRWDIFKGMDPVTKNIYYGLLHQKFKNERIVIKGEQLTEIFTPANLQNANNIQEFFRSMLTSAESIVEASKKLKDAKKEGKEDLSTLWAGVFESGKGFLDEATSKLVLINPVFQVPDQLNNTLVVSSKTLAIAHDIAVRNYSAVVVGTLALISEQLGDSKEISGFKSFFVKYASFGANVVQAKNSDDIEKAIEAVVLPVGSARIKRETLSNISLNAFVGIHASHEFIQGVSNQKMINSFGITAPVGVSFAWGTQRHIDSVQLRDENGKIFFTKHKRKNRKVVGRKSNGIFVSLIDIGAITTLRFGDDETAKLPTIQLKDIIAPGLYYSHGFGKVPISMNIGVQYGPLLRNVTPSATTLDRPYCRVGISFLVDIPLLNLYTKN